MVNSFFIEASFVLPQSQRDTEMVKEKPRVSPVNNLLEQEISVRYLRHRHNLRVQVRAVGV